jgi:hypothetical protein
VIKKLNKEVVISNSTRKEPNQSSVYTGEVDPAIAMHVLAVCFCSAMSSLRIEGLNSGCRFKWVCPAVQYLKLINLFN